MKRSLDAQKTSIWVVWFLAAFGATEVHRHSDSFTFWCGIVTLTLALPFAVFSTYRRLVGAHGAK